MYFFTRFFQRKNHAETKLPDHHPHIDNEGIELRDVIIHQSAEPTDVLTSGVPNNNPNISTNELPANETHIITTFVTQTEDNLPWYKKMFYGTLSLSMATASGAMAYLMINALTHQKEPLDERGLNQQAMDFTILYGLLSGAALQLSVNLLPYPIFRKKFNEFKHIGTALECASLFEYNGIIHQPHKIGNFTTSKEFKKIVTPWASLRYGIVLADLSVAFLTIIHQKIINNNPKTTENITTQINTTKPSLQSDFKKYISPVWISFLIFSIATLIINYEIDLKKTMSNSNAHYLNMILLSTGYGGLGFIAGDLLENIHPTEKLDLLHLISFYVYSMFLKPGEHYYNNILIVIGSIITGWSTAYSRRKFNIETELMQEQIQQLNLLLIHEIPLVNELKRLETQFTQEKTHQFKNLRKYKYSLFLGISLTVPFVSLFNRDPFFLSTCAAGYISLLTYYLAKYVKQDPYTPKPQSNISMFLNDNILLLSQLNLTTLLACRETILFSVLKDHLYNKGYSFTVPSGAFLGIITGSYFMSFFEDKDIRIKIKPARLENLISALTHQQESNQKNMIELTRSEILFISKNLKNNLSSQEEIRSQTNYQGARFFKLNVIDDDLPGKNFKEKAVIASFVLPYLSDEFPIKTADKLRPFRF